MRVLWISNIPFGPLCELAGESKSTSGSWLDAAYEALKNVDQLELIIVTTAPVEAIKMQKEGSHTFCLLPGGYPKSYDPGTAKNKSTWEKIYRDYQPDLIQCWGTEFSHGYLALQVMKGVPSVVYMQGVMSQIARYYSAGMSDKELNKSITLRDIIKLDWIKRQQADFLKRSAIEAEILRLSGNVIVENKWCKAHCEAAAPGCKTYFSKLNIKSTFFDHEWSVENAGKHSIMAMGAGYPLKGLHILLKAFHLVLRQFPGAILYVPGEHSPFKRTWKQNLRINGYTRFIKRLITGYGLLDHVIFLGRIDSGEMAQRMVRSHLFVMPSSIENHSSALIESMIVGMPCIASNVGGISEYLNHGENGMLYRFEEYEILASHICKIFGDSDLAQKLGKNARIEMRASRRSADLKNDLLFIYQDVYSSK